VKIHRSFNFESGRIDPLVFAFRTPARPVGPLAVLESKPARNAGGGPNFHFFSLCGQGLNNVGQMIVDRFFTDTQRLGNEPGIAFFLAQ